MDLVAPSRDPADAMHSDTAIALHELGHFLEAARLRALNDSIQDSVEVQFAAPRAARAPRGRRRGLGCC